MTQRCGDGPALHRDLPPRVVSISLSAPGAAMASRLPYEHRHGNPRAALEELWPSVEGLVLVLAVGAAVRLVAPLLEGKERDPAVVCLDDGGRFAVALLGGHHGRGGLGANSLARQVAAMTGAQAVCTTASEAAGVPALDALWGLNAEGDVASTSRALLEGRPVRLVVDNEWPAPAALAARTTLAGGAGDAGADCTIALSDLLSPPSAPGAAVLLRPPSLVVGIGSASDVTAAEMAALVDRALQAGGLSAASVAEVATIDRRASHPAVVALGHPVRCFPAAVLATVEVPTPSAAVEAAVGTPSVAEAAALRAAGTGAKLVVEKLVGRRATVAIARRRPRGHLSVVGLGPGSDWHRTPAADRALRQAEVVVGYGPYVDLARSLLGPGQQLRRFPLGAERARAAAAVEAAAQGRRVAMVCSGDPGVYAMATLVLELGGERSDMDVEVVPGVSAGLAAAAALGAPLAHDHLVLSLSDLLTPWSTIERRLRAALDGDLVVAIYNPRSRTRTWQLAAALAILAEGRSGDTPVGIVTDATRAPESVVVTTIDSLDPSLVGMTSTVIVGSSATRRVGPWMVTPRGYGAAEAQRAEP